MHKHTNYNAYLQITQDCTWYKCFLLLTMKLKHHDNAENIIFCAVPDIDILYVNQG